MTTAELVCSWEMSDPRVTGSEQADLVLNWAVLPADTMEHFFTTNDVLTNDAGTWRGCGWGSEYFDESDRLHTSGIGRYLGEDGYEGLSLFIQYAQGPDLGPNYRASGWIEPTDSLGQLGECQ